MRTFFWLVAWFFRKYLPNFRMAWGQSTCGQSWSIPGLQSLVGRRNLGWQERVLLFTPTLRMGFYPQLLLVYLCPKSLGLTHSLCPSKTEAAGLCDVLEVPGRFIVNASRFNCSSMSPFTNIFGLQLLIHLMFHDINFLDNSSTFLSQTFSSFPNIIDITLLL